MSTYCLAIDCNSNSEDKSLSFFRIPAVRNLKSEDLRKLTYDRREKWLRVLKRNLSENQLKCGRICSKHFISGEPSAYYDYQHPDWVPNQLLGFNYGAALKKPSDLQRYERTKRRAYQKMTILIEKSIPDVEEAEADNVVSLPNQVIETNGILSAEISENVETNDAIFPEKLNAGAQTVLTSAQLELNFSDMNISDSIIQKLKIKIRVMSLNQEAFEGNDKRTKYLTGFENSKLLFLIHDTIAPYLHLHNAKLSTFQQLVLTLMKLRLNLDFKYLADRFDVCQTTASVIFHRCLNILYKMFHGLVYWPSREALHATMPACFQESFGDSIAIIIDCFEIFIETPSNLYAAAQCWSQYKHHQTIKVLIGITPQGTISFISKAYGGRISDKRLTEDSGLLDCLKPHDVVLADRGFLIEEFLTPMQVTLKLPAFTKGKSQLHPLELEETRQIAHVGIHVERVIGALRQKFPILQEEITISMLATTEGDIREVDKIIHVCASLYNLNSSIVS